MRYVIFCHFRSYQLYQHIFFLSKMLGYSFKYNAITLIFAFIDYLYWFLLSDISKTRKSLRYPSIILLLVNITEYLINMKQKIHLSYPIHKRRSEYRKLIYCRKITYYTQNFTRNRKCQIMPWWKYDISKVRVKEFINIVMAFIYI